MSFETLKQRGVLRVLSMNSPNTWYIDPQGNNAGLEYELASRFADELGLKLELVTPATFSDLFRSLDAGNADFIASGITITKARKKRYKFSPPYQSITEVLVYRQGIKAPKDVTDLSNGRLRVLEASSFQERLQNLRKQYPELRWEVSDKDSLEQLLESVWKGEIDYTVTDSNIFNQARRLYPELQRAFDLGEPQQLAWVFPRDVSPGLYDAASSFIQRLEESGELQRILDRYYAHVEKFDYIDASTFLSHYIERLPKYKSMFQASAKKHGMDWHLLAAIAYQESHWRPDAVSPTGVRGMMMLTRNTAKMMNIKNRKDPAQSIEGGAAYIKRMLGKIPERIKDPDRTWFALAAYNIGYGHLEDARIITEKEGHNPDLWKDVRKHLPLLSKKKWYSKTRYGFARGSEPVRYVGNIRRYYDVLVRLSQLSDPERKGTVDRVFRDSFVF